MHKPFVSLLFPLGLAVLTTLLFQGGTVLVSAQPGAASTPDRLSEPTLPAMLSQADHGAHMYWHYCMPCHGDYGQGLTADFIALWPEEDQNCWASGCHGEKHYEGGYSVPHYIPPVIGPGALGRFASAADLYDYIHTTMPCQSSSGHEDEVHWQLTAFLLRANGRWDGQGRDQPIEHYPHRHRSRNGCRENMDE